MQTNNDSTNGVTATVQDRENSETLVLCGRSISIAVQNKLLPRDPELAFFDILTIAASFFHPA
jgi:hypothetical protein